jgi:hypothetical protein
MAEETSGGKDKKEKEKKEEKKEEKKGEEKKEEKKGEEVKVEGCPPGKSCVTQGLANMLNDRANVVELAQKKFEAGINDRVTSFKQTVSDTFTNPVKCAANVGQFIPDMVDRTLGIIENRIQSIGNAAAEATDKLTRLAQDDDGFPNIMAPFHILFTTKLKTMQDFIADKLFGEDFKVKLRDPNMKPEKILESLLTNSEGFKKIVDSPIFQKIFQDWLNNYAKAIDKAIDLGKVPIDRVTDKLTGVVTNTSKKIGEALTGSLTEVITAALKSIPFVGIAVNIAAVAKTIAVKLVALCEPAISKGGWVVAKVANTGMDQIKKADCQFKSLQAKLGPLLNSSKTGGDTEQSGGGAEQSGGGGHYQVRKKIRKATRRVQRLLRLFTRKHARTPPHSGHRFKIRRL